MKVECPNDIANIVLIIIGILETLGFIYHLLFWFGIGLIPVWLLFAGEY